MTPAMTAITDFPELQTLAFEVAEAASACSGSTARSG